MDDANVPKASQKAYEAVSKTTSTSRISSAELLRGRHELEIDHGGDVYRLRLTKAGKLILTK